MGGFNTPIVYYYIVTATEELSSHLSTSEVPLRNFRYYFFHTCRHLKPTQRETRNLSFQHFLT